MHRKKIKFNITGTEKKLIEDVEYLEPYMQEILRKKIRQGQDRYAILMEEEDLQDLIHALEYHAGCKVGARNDRGRAFCDRLKGYLKLVIDPVR